MFNPAKYKHTLGEILKISCRTVDMAQSNPESILAGLPPGLSTGWSDLDQFFKLTPGQLNVVTGFPGSGKSEWIENLAINAAINHSWKIFYYSPENYPHSLHLLKLCEKHSGRTASNYCNIERLTHDDISNSMEFLKKHFEIVDAADKPAPLDQILYSIMHGRSMYGKEFDMAIIDPWNELDGFRPAGITETDWIGECLMTIRRFSRIYNISFWIVAHPQKPARTKTGEYPSLSLYDISGSQHWYNKSDNGFVIERNYEENFKYITKIGVRKIKNRYYGAVGDVFLEFEPATGRYKHWMKNQSTTKEIDLW